MLHVKIELVPFGIEEARHKIDEIFIANDGTGDSEEGNYNVFGSDPRDVGSDPAARVEGYLRAEGAAALVRKALEALEG